MCLCFWHYILLWSVSCLSNSYHACDSGQTRDAWIEFELIISITQLHYMFWVKTSADRTVEAQKSFWCSGKLQNTSTQLYPHTCFYFTGFSDGGDEAEEGGGKVEVRAAVSVSAGLLISIIIVIAIVALINYRRHKSCWISSSWFMLANPDSECFSSCCRFCCSWLFSDSLASLR